MAQRKEKPKEKPISEFRRKAAIEAWTELLRRQPYQPLTMAEELRVFIRARFSCHMGTREDWLEVLEVAKTELPTKRELPRVRR